MANTLFECMTSRQYEKKEEDKLPLDQLRMAEIYRGMFRLACMPHSHTQFEAVAGFVQLNRVESIADADDSCADVHFQILDQDFRPLNTSDAPGVCTGSGLWVPSRKDSFELTRADGTVEAYAVKGFFVADAADVDLEALLDSELMTAR